jgi:predicted nucleic acid-binding protein
VLIDTNVWSELSKPRPDPLVSRWVAEHFDQCVLSTLVLAEMRYGIAIADDEARRRHLQSFHDDLILRIGERIVPFDEAAAASWGQLRALLKRSGQLIADMDILIAAQALGLGMPLVTRNVSDMARTGALIINPWES